MSAEAWLELIHPGDRIRLRAMIDAHLLTDGPGLRCEHRLRHSDESWRWVRTCGLATRDGAGQPQRLIGTTCDISLEHQAEAARGRDVLRDPLTGLPSRALLDRSGGAAHPPGGTRPRLHPGDPARRHRPLPPHRGALRPRGRGRPARRGRLDGWPGCSGRPTRPREPVMTSSRCCSTEPAGRPARARWRGGCSTRSSSRSRSTADGCSSRRRSASRLGEAEVADGEALLERAEAAMYLAKRTARGGARALRRRCAGECRRRVGREVELRRLIEDGATGHPLPADRRAERAPGAGDRGARPLGAGGRCPLAARVRAAGRGDGADGRAQPPDHEPRTGVAGPLARGRADRRGGER